MKVEHDVYLTPLGMSIALEIGMPDHWNECDDFILPEIAMYALADMCRNMLVVCSPEKDAIVTQIKCYDFYKETKCKLLDIIEFDNGTCICVTKTKWSEYSIKIEPCHFEAYGDEKVVDTPAK